MPCVMGSEERRRSKSSGTSSRRWTSNSTLLADELSLETLQDTTYVRLMHPDRRHTVFTTGLDAVGCFEDPVVDVSRKGTTTTRSEKAWSWLRRPLTSRNGRDGKEATATTVVMAKSKSYRVARALLGRPAADGFQFDPTKRWPQGW